MGIRFGRTLRVGHSFGPLWVSVPVTITGNSPQAGRRRTTLAAHAFSLIVTTAVVLWLTIASGSLILIPGLIVAVAYRIHKAHAITKSTATPTQQPR